MQTIELQLSDPLPVYDSGSGVTLTIGAARLGDLALEGADDVASALEDPSSQSLLILTILLVNQRDATIGLYPDQGTAVVGTAQVEASVFLSGSFTGEDATIPSGASPVEEVTFELPQSAAEVAALGEVRYTVAGPFDFDTSEPVGSDVDLTISWAS
jgi:hypothetical protein